MCDYRLDLYVEIWDPPCMPLKVANSAAVDVADVEPLIVLLGRVGVVTKDGVGDVYHISGCVTLGEMIVWP